MRIRHIDNRRSLNNNQTFLSGRWQIGYIQFAVKMSRTITHWLLMNCEHEASFTIMRSTCTYCNIIFYLPLRKDGCKTSFQSLVFVHTTTLCLMEWPSILSAKLDCPVAHQNFFRVRRAYQIKIQGLLKGFLRTILNFSRTENYWGWLSPIFVFLFFTRQVTLHNLEVWKQSSKCDLRRSC